jgi:L-2-hydroxyglutarate oxidase LhgO
MRPGSASSIEGMPAQHIPHPYYAQGAYFSCSAKVPFSRLIYPVPGESSHLGVHLTLDLGGQGRFGPSFRWLDDVDYTVHEEDSAGFTEAVRRYWPGLPDDALHPGYAGVRPKITGPGEAAADFRLDGESVHGVPGLVNLFGIESPGLTSCLSIAQWVVEQTCRSHTALSHS